MDFTNKLKETTDKYYKEVNSIKELKTFEEVDAMERQCVDCLQALQVLVGEASRDLYATVQARRAEIQAAAITPVEEIKKPEEKPAKKAAKKSGKNSK